jgi:hypothetical protein
MALSHLVYPFFSGEARPPPGGKLMHVGRKTHFVGLAALSAALILWVSGASFRAHADGGDDRLEGAWRITISSPPNCQAAPPACITASELTNFYPGGTLTETNTILFAAGEPNPPNFSSASDGYGVWKRTDNPGEFSVLFEKFLFRTESVPTSVSPTGKLVVNSAVAKLEGKYTVVENALSGTFTIKITPPNDSTVLFEANGTVTGVRFSR